MTALRLALLALLLLRASLSPAGDYYVSPTGDDANPGTQAMPWQTIDRLNRTSFVAGDHIHFEGGATFTGNLEFGADDTGTAALPITVDSYGTGRAILDAGAGKGISIYNTSAIELRGLVLRGGWDATLQSGSFESGVELYTDLPGLTRLPHVVVEDLDVSGFRGSGLVIAAWPTDATMGGFSGVRFERCDAHDNGDAGISSWGYWNPGASDYSHHDIVVRRCRVFRNRGISGLGGHSGNGIVMGGLEGGLIEQCEAFENGDLCDNVGGGPVGIWCWDAKDVVIQSCESHHNRTGAFSGDGGGFDLDGGVTDSVMQYNYSHDNDGAGYLVYQFYGARPSLSGNVVRYNVSQDDGRQHGYSGIYLGDGSLSGNEVHDNVFHGNTIYMSDTGNAGIAAVIIDGAATGNAFHDNVLMTSGGVALVRSDRAHSRGSVAFQGNAWWAGAGAFQAEWGGSTHASLASWRAAGQETFGVTPTGLEADPMFLNAGGGATVADPDALAALDAYLPMPGSPLLDAGLDLALLFGVDPGNRDYAGTLLPQGAGLDIGAFELAAPCTLPGSVGGTLRVAKPSSDILFTWADIPSATSYELRHESALPGVFVNVTGSSSSGVSGLRLSMPAGPLFFYRVLGGNPCGFGPF